MGWEVEVVSHPRRPRGMWVFPGEEIDYSLFEQPKGFRHLPRSFVTPSLVPSMGPVTLCCVKYVNWYQVLGSAGLVFGVARAISAKDPEFCPLL